MAESASTTTSSTAANHNNNNNNGPSIVSNTLLPLSNQAVDTLKGLASAGGELRPSAFCHEDRGEVRGWILDMPVEMSGLTLPMPHNLFHGLSLVQCEVTETEALDLMRRGSETRQALREAVCALRAEATQPATWQRCRPGLNGVPSSLHAATRDREGRVQFGASEMHPAILDGAAWTPELSPDGFVGFYFQWNETRLELFAACQGYLPQACADFADMVHRAGGGCTAGYICLSEEAQWLRAACARNRARILARVCAHLGVRVPCMTDYCGGASGERMAIVCAETLHHDLVLVGGGRGPPRVRMYNYCCAETRGGSLCVMAPWEGVWLFRGTGDGGTRWAFPTTTPRLRERVRHFTFSTRPRECRTVLSLDETDDAGVDEVETMLRALASPCGEPERNAVAYLVPPASQAEKEGSSASESALIRDAYRWALMRHVAEEDNQYQQLHQHHERTAWGGSGTPSEAQYHLVFDEPVLQQMTGLGWTRAQGINKLLPLCVVQCRAPLEPLF
jgi:hypothetical protein